MIINIWIIAEFPLHARFFNELVDAGQSMFGKFDIGSS